MDNGFNDELFKETLDINDMNTMIQHRDAHNHYFLYDHRKKDNHYNQGPSTNNMDSNMNSSLKNMSTPFPNAFNHNANHKNNEEG